MIPLLDMQASTDELREELEEVFSRFLDSGRYVLGAEVTAFETEYARYCDAEHCVGVSSGLDALHLALRAIGIEPGDEVIVPSNTYIATWLAVTHAGGHVVPVEPDPGTFCIDPAKIGARITNRTRAVLATNLYGLPVDYDSIRDVTNSAGIAFLVDNAQASGAKYRGRPVGGIADLECHSFYPTKNLGALGEAGAVTTSRTDFADRIRLLRNYGSGKRYHHEACGFNNRLDELQAGILRVKLKQLDEWNKRRRYVAALYQERMSSIPQIRLPLQPDWCQSAWHLFVVRVSRRDHVCARLAESGIGWLVHYPIPPHRSEAYATAGFGEDEFPIANALAGSVLSIPMGPHLTRFDAEMVAKALVHSVEKDADDSNRRCA